MMMPPRPVTNNSLANTTGKLETKAESFPKAVNEISDFAQRLAPSD